MGDVESRFGSRKLRVEVLHSVHPGAVLVDLIVVPLDGANPGDGVGVLGRICRIVIGILGNVAKQRWVRSKKQAWCAVRHKPNRIFRVLKWANSQKSLMQAQIKEVCTFGGLLTSSRV